MGSWALFMVFLTSIAASPVPSDDLVRPAIAMVYVAPSELG